MWCSIILSFLLIAIGSLAFETIPRSGSFSSVVATDGLDSQDSLDVIDIRFVPHVPGESCPDDTRWYGTFCKYRRRTKSYYLSCRPVSKHGGLLLHATRAKRLPGECPAGFSCRPHNGVANPRKQWYPDNKEKRDRPSIDCVPAAEVPTEKAIAKRRRQTRLELDRQHDAGSSETIEDGGGWMMSSFDRAPVCKRPRTQQHREDGCDRDGRNTAVRTQTSSSIWARD